MLVVFDPLYHLFSITIVDIIFCVVQLTYKKSIYILDSLLRMSKAKLEAFLQRPRPCIDHLSHTPILLSDSKGFLLQREDTDNKIIYWCESGATAATLVKTLETGYWMLISNMAK